MNSVNWPALSAWVLFVQLVQHCSVNAEAMGSNPVEGPKKFFQATSQLLKLRFNRDDHIIISFRIPAVHIISFCVSFLSRVDELNKLVCTQCMGLLSSAGRALQHECRGHGSESR